LHQNDTIMIYQHVFSLESKDRGNYEALRAQNNRSTYDDCPAHHYEWGN
jgi:hypothetical protein